jgi:hypothetical protein
VTGDGRQKPRPPFQPHTARHPGILEDPVQGAHQPAAGILLGGQTRAALRLTEGTDAQISEAGHTNSPVNIWCLGLLSLVQRLLSLAIKTCAFLVNRTGQSR